MDYAQEAGRVMDTASARGAAYCDVRFERTRSERAEVRNGDVSGLADERSDGYGIRALVDGAWGFAASNGFADAELDVAADRAVAAARAAASIATRRIGSIPRDRYVDTFTTVVERDPRDIPLGDRIARSPSAGRGSISGGPRSSSSPRSARKSRKRSSRAGAG